ncbi:hypothetical protein C8R45DRAFT_1210214 [Mycena sanguinolenta]|nr:hypothetical protein C8R45DRAFT_1210214 [Mycena sanguinolenta]
MATVAQLANALPSVQAATSYVRSRRSVFFCAPLASLKHVAPHILPRNAMLLCDSFRTLFLYRCAAPSNHIAHDVAEAYENGSRLLPSSSYAVLSHRLKTRQRLAATPPCIPRNTASTTTTNLTHDRIIEYLIETQYNVTQALSRTATMMSRVYLLLYSNPLDLRGIPLDQGAYVQEDQIVVWLSGFMKLRRVVALLLRRIVNRQSCSRLQSPILTLARRAHLAVDNTLPGPGECNVTPAAPRTSSRRTCPPPAPPTATMPHSRPLCGGYDLNHQCCPPRRMRRAYRNADLTRRQPFLDGEPHQLASPLKRTLTARRPLRQQRGLDRWRGDAATAGRAATTTRTRGNDNAYCAAHDDATTQQQCRPRRPGRPTSDEVHGCDRSAVPPALPAVPEPPPRPGLPATPECRRTHRLGISRTATVPSQSPDRVLGPSSSAHTPSTRPHPAPSNARILFKQYYTAAAPGELFRTVHFARDHLRSPPMQHVATNRSDDPLTIPRTWSSPNSTSAPQSAALLGTAVYTMPRRIDHVFLQFYDEKDRRLPADFQRKPLGAIQIYGTLHSLSRRGGEPPTWNTDIPWSRTEIEFIPAFSFLTLLSLAANKRHHSPRASLAFWVHLLPTPTRTLRYNARVVSARFRPPADA